MIDKKLLRIQILLEDLDKRLSFVERSRVLSLPPQELFSIYSPIQMEERAIPIVSLYSHSDILLSVFWCELKEWMDEYIGKGKIGLNENQISKIGELASFITNLREKHINTFGRNVYAAFHYRLLSPEEHAVVELNTLERLLIRFFGSADLAEDSLALSRLKHMMVTSGYETTHLLQALRLINGIDHLVSQSSAVPSIPVHAGTWLSNWKLPLPTLQAKISHLQRDLAETIRELNLDRHSQENLFQNLSLSVIRVKISYLHQKFIKGDLLLKCYEAELRFALMEYDQMPFSESMRETIAAVQKSISIIRQEYIKKYTAKVTIALKQRLGVYENTDDSVRHLDKCLVYAFDMGIMHPADTRCPGLQEWQEFLVSLGKLLKMEEDANAIGEGIRSLAI